MLGKLVLPDRYDLPDSVTTVQLLSAAYSFLFPGNKENQFFEGARVIVLKTHSPDDPSLPFTSYPNSRDRLWPFSVHSLQAGGGNGLAEAVVPVHIIPASGR
jgi:hypothetical protein